MLRARGRRCRPRRRLSSRAGRRPPTASGGAAARVSPMNGRGHARSLVAPVGRPVRQAAIGRRTRDWPDRSRLFVLERRASAGRSTTRRPTRPPSRARRATLLGAPLVGAVHAAAGRLPHEPLRGCSTRAGRARPTARVAVLPRAPGDARLPRVRPCLRVARAHSRPLRPDPGDASRDGAARRRRGRRPEKGAPDPDRDRRSALPARRTTLGATPPGPSSASTPTRSSSARSRRTASGWATGTEPKAIKGPDVLVEALALVHGELERLVVLLTGPARGYVRAELERLGVPHVHRLLPDRDGLTAAYHALDAYLVASRRGGRPEERARVDGDGGAARHDAPDRRRTSSSRARTACTGRRGRSRRARGRPAPARGAPREGRPVPRRRAP